VQNGHELAQRPILLVDKMIRRLPVVAYGKLVCVVARRALTAASADNARYGHENLGEKLLLEPLAWLDDLR